MAPPLGSGAGPAGSNGAGLDRDAELIELDGTALAVFARLLGPDVGQIASGPSIELLAETMNELGAPGVADELEQIDDAAVADTESLHYIWTSLFVRSTVPPYETSYMTGNIVGHTGELADIAGFYKAFGFEADGERADHLLPELEFASFLTLREAEALREGNEGGFETCNSARISFLREHLGCWVDDFADRLEREQPANPYLVIVRALANYLESLCRRMAIEPLKPVELAPAPTAALELDSDGEPMGCFGEPAPTGEFALPDQEPDPLSVRPVHRP